MSSNENWERLGRLLSEQRGRIESNARAFADQTGLNYRLVWDLENARRTNYRVAKLAEVEKAYRWGPGSIKRVLDGGNPTPIGEDGSLLVPAGSRPPIETAHDPDVRLRDVHPLQEGELLEGWRHEDGRWHWLFVTVVNGRPETLRISAEAHEKPEDIAAEMRQEILRRR